MEKFKLGVVGATGLVGQIFLKLLSEQNLLAKFQLYLITSEKSAGKRMFFGGEEHKLYALNEKCLNFDLDAVIFSAGDEISKSWALKFKEKGCLVIDNTNAFRKFDDVPLVVPEINGGLIKDNMLIANPNCSTIQLAVVLDRLKKVANIKKVIVSTYQSVSGAGKKALNDLFYHQKNVFEQGINNNIIANIGSLSENGFCTEENKIMFELNKILEMSFDVYATAVRVPIQNCHGESVYVKFDRKINLEQIENSLNCDYIKFSSENVFVPTECVNSNLTFVCRLRQISDNEILFFVIADNLRRGASYNALKILQISLNIA